MSTLREIIQRATPGPWSPDVCEDGSWRMDATYGTHNRPCVIASRNGWSNNKEQSAANAQLIARCNPATMLAVIEALEEASTALQHMPPDEPKDGTIQDRRIYNEKWCDWNKRQCAAVVRVRYSLALLNLSHENQITPAS